jgi:aminoglycoside phosphotransferase (APT) family kinase protein
MDFFSWSLSGRRRTVMGLAVAAAFAGTAYYLFKSPCQPEAQQKPLKATAHATQAGSSSLNLDCDSDSEQNDDEDDELKDFLPVIEALNLEALRKVATQARISQLSVPSVKDESRLTCEISNTPVCGSFNLVYIITFSDESRMVARLPGKGTNFEELDRMKMEHEYRTMRLIKARTTIPIPEVFLWQTTMSDVGVPFALMSFMPGMQICDAWFDADWVTEAKRLKILDQIAMHMSQLHQLNFPGNMGAPSFDDKGELTGIGPRYDYLSGLESEVAWDVIQSSGPWSSVDEYRRLGWDAVDEENENEPLDVGPFIMRLASESIPDYMNGRGRTYIRHPDLAWHNILIDNDANVTAFIDWDGVDVIPCSIGFGSYPSWLTRDWDPAMYGYEDDGTATDDTVEESSPAELSRYRQHYATSFSRRMLPPYDARETRLSHIAEAIEISMGNSFSRNWIVPKILVHAFRGAIPFKYRQLAQDYAAGTAADTIEVIKQAFTGMWYAEWEASANEQALLYRCSTSYWRATVGFED